MEFIETETALESVWVCLAGSGSGSPHIGGRAFFQWVGEPGDELVAVPVRQAREL